MFGGCLVAMVTPFKKDGSLDEKGLRKNICFLLQNGASGLVPCATTGESPSLSEDEYEQIIKITIKTAKGKAKVIAGAGTNSTFKTIKLAAKAKKLGVDGCLVVTPYYNKPNQEGLYQHFGTVAKEVNIPIIIYNVPSRTGVNILPKTVLRLVHNYQGIVGIKEASGSLDQVSEIARGCGKGFDVLSGDDSLTLPMLALGAKGVISVIGNIMPKEIAAMIRFYHQGKIAQAKAIHLKLFPLMKTLFIETNPIPIKQAMHFVGMSVGKPRLPLVPLSKENMSILRKELKVLKLIK